MSTIQGVLRDGQLTEVVGRVFAERLTGKLRLAAGSTQICIYFTDGQVSYATSSDQQHKIGALLVREGLIAPGDRAAAIGMLMPGKRLGEVLVELGKIRSGDLTRALTKQVLSICASAFCMPEGNYVFNEAARIPDDLHLPELSTPNLVMDAIKRDVLREETKSALGPPTAQLKLRIPSSEVRKLIELSPSEIRILTRIDGSSTLGEIAMSAPGAEVETTKLLYGLHVLGFVGPAVASAPETGWATVSDERDPPAGAGDARSSSRRSSESAEVERLYPRIDSLDYYDLLGVPDNASAEEIRRAYLGLVKRCHPDRMGSRTDAAMTKKAERVFAKLTEAYQVLIDEASRRSYDQAAPNQKAKFDAHTARRPVTKTEMEANEKWAQGSYEKGRELFAARMYGEAVQRLSQAVRANPRNAQYAIALAWAQGRNRSTMHEAEKTFLRAVNIDKFNPEPCVQMGKFYREVGETEKARALFQRALALDDENEVALREIAELDGATQKKSLWGRVTGRLTRS